VPSPEEIKKWRAELCEDGEGLIAHKYGFAVSSYKTVVIDGKKEKVVVTMTIGEFFDKLGEAMKACDPLLGA
jgi:hypothetical protein